MSYSQICPVPDSAACQTALGLFPALHDALDAGELSKVVALREEILSLCQVCAHATHDWMRAKDGLGQLLDAGVRIDELVQEDEYWNPEVLRFKGRLERLRENDADAVIWYTKACEVMPNEHGVFCEMAELLMWLDRWEDAVSYARKAEETEPEEHQALVQLYAILSKTGEKDALAPLETRIRQLPWSDVDLLLAASRTFQEAEEIDLAIEWCERAIDLEPEYPKALCLGSRLYYYAREDYDASIELFEKLALVDPSQHGLTSVLHIARILGEKRGDWKSALGRLVEERVRYPADHDLEDYAQYVIERVSGTLEEESQAHEHWRRRFEALEHDHSNLQEAIREIRSASEQGTPLQLALLEGEGQEIEFIESYPENGWDLAKEIAAFSTSNDGTIFVGIRDDGFVAGLGDVATTGERDSLLQRVSGLTSGVVKPQTEVRVAFLQFDGKTILRIFVPKASRPVYYVGTAPYLRHLDKSRPAEWHEVEDLVRQHAGRVGGA